MIVPIIIFWIVSWPVSFSQETTSSVIQGEAFLTLANQKKELILAAMFVGRMEPNEEAL
jgi:hypothetical protein